MGVQGVQWVVVACVGVSILSNAIFRGVGRVSADNTLPFTPARRAFSIWVLIYCALVAFAGRQRWSTAPAQVNALLGASLLLCALWTASFTRGTRTALLAAGVVVVCAAACALAALVLLGPQGRRPYDTLFLEAPLSLYAGWLMLAATLGVGIALRSFGVHTSAVAVLVPSAAAAAVAVGLKQPFVLAPVLWGLAFTPKTGPVTCSLALVGLATACALYRRYFPA